MGHLPYPGGGVKWLHPRPGTSSQGGDDLRKDSEATPRHGPGAAEWGTPMSLQLLSVPSHPKGSDGHGSLRLPQEDYTGHALLESAEFGTHKVEECPRGFIEEGEPQIGHGHIYSDPPKRH